MVKAHCVIITAQVDMLIVVYERIMELQLSKKMMMNESKILEIDSGWCRLLMLFWTT